MAIDKNKHEYKSKYYIILASGLLLSIFLAGGPRQGSSGVFLIFAGLGLMLCPPKTSVSWVFWALGFVFLVSSCLSLLPKEVMLSPAWRSQLASMGSFHNPWTVSISPWETTYWILLASISVALGLCALSQPLSSKEVELFSLVAVSGVSLYALFAMTVWLNGWHYVFFQPDPSAQPCFGFFPSRNQTSSLLLSATIVSAALVMQSLVSGKFIRGVYAGATLSVLASGVLFFSKSRGGVVFLFFGLALWLAGLGRRRLGFMLPLLFPVVLALLIFFAFSPGGARDRLFGLERRDQVQATGKAAKGGELGMSSRLRIFHDTFRMIGAYPLTGSGLGTYAYIYPFYSDKSLSEATALHAESDWLTLLEEGGVFALLAAFGVLTLLCVQIRKFYQSDSWPLRWGLFCAFLAEVAHGFVDVPAHRPELGWWMLLLATLPSAFMAGNSRFLGLQRCIYIGVGFVALVLGMILISAQWLGAKPLPPYFLRSAVGRIIALYGEGKFDEAADFANRARFDYPMGWELSYLQGVSTLAKGRPASDAIQLFDMENDLRPMNDVPPQKAGTALLGYDPDHASLYWKEAVRRRLRMDSSSNCPIARSNELFRSMLADKSMRPEFLKQAGEIATWSPGLRMIWLTDTDCPSPELSRALNDSSFMNQLSAKQQGDLLYLWWERGDRSAVSGFLDSHPEYTTAAIKTKAAMLLASGQPEKACNLLIKTFQIPMPLPASGSSIQPAGVDVPQDILAAAKYYLERGNIVAARHDLEDAAKEGRPAVEEAEILLLKARLEMASGHWLEAVPLLFAYLHDSGRL